VEKLYAVEAASGMHQRFFGQKFDPNMQFGCIAWEVDDYSG
jgi:hypothetical protein